MEGKMYGNEYRTVMVCVDSYDNGVLAGRLYHPILRGGERFQSVMQFLYHMNDLLDRMHFPQPFMATRSFLQPEETPAGMPAEGEVRGGALATFALRVLFRQNASWQGSVTWVESGREESFRSVLELLFLMDSALKAKP
jgi:hypothetical protein